MGPSPVNKLKELWSDAVFRWCVYGGIPLLFWTLAGIGVFGEGTDKAFEFGYDNPVSEGMGCIHLVSHFQHSHTLGVEKTNLQLVEQESRRRLNNPELVNDRLLFRGVWILLPLSTQLLLRFQIQHSIEEAAQCYSLSHCTTMLATRS